METDKLPDETEVEEVRLVSRMFESFANKKKDYFLYLSRLDAIHEERTLRNAVRQTQGEKYLTQEEKEQARRKKKQIQDQIRKEIEQARNKMEEACKLADETGEEIRLVFRMFESFATNKKDHFLYMNRLDAIRQERTWQNALRRAQKERDQARKEREQIQKETEIFREQARKEKEQREQVRIETEQFRKDKEELMKLLKQAGIKSEE